MDKFLARKHMPFKATEQEAVTVLCLTLKSWYSLARLSALNVWESVLQLQTDLYYVFRVVCTRVALTQEQAMVVNGLISEVLSSAY